MPLRPFIAIPHHLRRGGFSAIEVTVAIGLLIVGATCVAQTAVWSLNERSLADTRLDAMEWANNILEEARSRNWSELTADWGNAQKLPPRLADRMQQPAATIRVEPEPGRPRIKRVTISIRWFIAEGAKAPPVDLMALFADRTTEAKP